MGKTLNDYNEGILRRMYLSLFPVTALNGLLSCLGTLVDSLIVSNLLGAQAMAALGLTSPLVVFFWLFINVLSNGTTVFCGRCLGKGELDRVNGSFTACLTVLAGVGVGLGVVLGLFHNPIARLLGATEELLPMAGAYVMGLAVSAAGIALSGPLSSFLIFANKQKMTFVFVVILVSVNAVCDVVFVQFLHMGMFGMGLATGISYYCADAVILLQFIKGSSAIHLDMKHMSWKEMPEIVCIGLPVASMELCNFLRPIFFNRTLLKYAGVLAVSAFAAEGSLASFFGSLCGGAGSLTLTVGSVIAGEADETSLTRFAKVVYKYGLCIVLATCTLLFIFAGFLVRPFCGGDPEVAVLAAQASRCLAVCLVLNVLVMITVRFYQALGYGKLVSVLNVLDYFVFPMLWLLLLSPGLKATGAWLTLILAEASTMVVILVLLAVKLKRARFSLRELILFGGSIDVPESDRLDTTLYSMEDVIGISRYVQDFCQGLGLAKKTAMLSALAVEEMAGNIVEHGFADGKKHAVDIRVIKRDDEIVIRLRDNCAPFDPKQHLERMDPSDPTKNIGIRMIAALSREMTYQALFHMNVTTIRLAAG